MTEFSQYREITGKLKKRFTLRKPNFREATDSFKKLAAELSDFPDYAGFCLLSAAQCEHNIVGALREQQLSSSSSSGIRGNETIRNPQSFASNTNPSSTAKSENNNNNNNNRKPGSAAEIIFDPAVARQNIAGLGIDRVMQTATRAEAQTWLDAARSFCAANEVNGAISAFAHAAQISAEASLPLIYSEWADMFRSRQRYHEAAQIYLEGGLIRDAISALLAGQYFEFAYRCYLELLKLSANKVDAMFLAAFGGGGGGGGGGSGGGVGTNISRTASSTSSRTNNTINVSEKSSSSAAAAAATILPFFGKRNDKSETIKLSENNPYQAKSGDRASYATLHRPPAGSDGGPFADCDHLTIDDYIFIFLLRLYLYDPIKYEYPSPIIPLPAEVVASNFALRTMKPQADKDDDEDEEEVDDHRREERTNTITSQTISSDMIKESDFVQSPSPKPCGESSSSPTTISATNFAGNNNLRAANHQHAKSALREIRLSTAFLPFVDFHQYRRSERTIGELIELNMLLETLYLSYRNELRRTIDHDCWQGGAGDDGVLQAHDDDEDSDEDSSSFLSSSSSWSSSYDEDELIDDDDGNNNQNSDEIEDFQDAQSNVVVVEQEDKMAESVEDSDKIEHIIPNLASPSEITITTTSAETISAQIEPESEPKISLPIAQRIDSIDDDGPTTTMTNTTATTATTTTNNSISGGAGNSSSSAGGSSSSSSDSITASRNSSFGKNGNDLDDISTKLAQLARQFGGHRRRRRRRGGNGDKNLEKKSKNKKFSEQQKQSAKQEDDGDELKNNKSSDDVDNEDDNDNEEDDYRDLERKFAYQRRMLETNGDNDRSLRRRIGAKLFPLLGSHQNQLLYLILSEKE